MYKRVPWKTVSWYQYEVSSLKDSYIRNLNETWDQLFRGVSYRSDWIKSANLINGLVHLKVHSWIRPLFILDTGWFEQHWKQCINKILWVAKYEISTLGISFVVPCITLYVNCLWIFLHVILCYEFHEEWEGHNCCGQFWVHNTQCGRIISLIVPSSDFLHSHILVIGQMIFFG